jgi:hypothetical protein
VEVGTCVAITARWFASSIADCEYLLWHKNKMTIKRKYEDLNKHLKEGKEKAIQYRGFIHILSSRLR